MTITRISVSVGQKLLTILSLWPTMFKITARHPLNRYSYQLNLRNKSYSSVHVRLLNAWFLMKSQFFHFTSSWTPFQPLYLLL